MVITLPWFRRKRARGDGMADTYCNGEVNERGTVAVEIWPKFSANVILGVNGNPSETLRVVV